MQDRKCGGMLLWLSLRITAKFARSRTTRLRIPYSWLPSYISEFCTRCAPVGSTHKRTVGHTAAFAWFTKSINVPKTTKLAYAHFERDKRNAAEHSAQAHGTYLHRVTKKLVTYTLNVTAAAIARCNAGSKATEASQNSPVKLRSKTNFGVKA